MVVTITEGGIYTLYGVFGLFGLTLVFLIWALWKTPLLTFAKAVLSGNPLFIMLSNTGFYNLKIGKKPKFQASYIKKIGPVFLSPNSGLIERGSKIQTFFIFGEMGATIPPEYPAILETAREKGLKVRNFDDYKDIAENEELPINIPLYKTFKVNGLKDMFPYDMSSAFLDSIIESEKQAGNIFNDNLIKWAFAGGFFLVCAAIAVYVIFNMTQQAPTETIIRTVELVNNSRVVV